MSIKKIDCYFLYILSVVRMIYQLIGYGAAALFGLVVVEHITKVSAKEQYRPSTQIVRAVEPCRNFFIKIGKWIARLSQFYTYLHLDKFVDSIGDIVIPIGKIIISPVWTIAGYLEFLKTYIGRRWVIVAGSATIALLIWAAFAYGLGWSAKTGIYNMLKWSYAGLGHTGNSALWVWNRVSQFMNYRLN
jgi:hypothetical protein